jgi:hypothetical protein
MEGRSLIGKWAFRTDPPDMMMVEEEFEIKAEGTYHLLTMTTRNGKPFGESEAWGEWRLEGDRLILSPKRVVTQSGVPGKPPIVKEGDIPIYMHTIEWRGEDEWRSADFPNSPFMKRIK